MKYEYLIPENNKDVEGIKNFIYGVKGGIEMQEEWDLYLKVIYFLCKTNRKSSTVKQITMDIFERDPSQDYHRALVLVRTQLKALSKIGITKSFVSTKKEHRRKFGNPCSEYTLT